MLGLGAGGDDEAPRAFALEVLNGHQKVEALEEAIDVIRGLWTTAESTNHGRHFRLEAASIDPRPSRPIPTRRDPDDITHACNVQVLIDGDLGPRRGQVTGAAEEVTRQLQNLAGLGFTFINTWPAADSASLPSQLARNVTPVRRGVDAN